MSGAAEGTAPNSWHSLSYAVVSAAVSFPLMVLAYRWLTG